MLSIAKETFVELLDVLAADGYRLVGPKIREEAIVYDEIRGAADLPVGWTDEQAPGRYRLERRDDDKIFGFAVGPHSWKQFLFPPSETLVQIRRRGSTMEVEAPALADDKVAFIGARACDIAAMGVLDRVFEGGPSVDPRYSHRRTHALVVAVNCLEAGGLCFCDSMGTGPRVEGGYDVCLTELEDRFLVEVGTALGQSVVDRLDTVAAEPEDRKALDDGIEHCRRSMGRKMDPVGLPELLFGNLDHPRWDDVASRCLSCGNCTQVCPTCFCHAVDSTSVVGEDTQTTTRRWESCFTPDHAYIHGGTFRPTIRQRYRQWLTHKVGSWVSQFGTSGCVGCGRCIAWCPAAIDITEEVAALRTDAKPPVSMPPPTQYTITTGDPLTPMSARVVEVYRETADVVTLAIEPPGPFRYQPGQFNMVSLPGVGDPPISISGHEGSTLFHTIRAVGAATRVLCELQPGDAVGVRGPFGSAWPLEEARGRNVMVIAGGIGLAPLRGALREMIARPDLYPSVRLLYGARTPQDVVYDTELLRWNRLHAHFKASVTVDHGSPQWNGHVGVVTTLLRRKEISAHGIYMICGPEVMMRFVIEQLHADGVPDDRIYVSMERNMQCAAGFCGRCQYGPYFICKDGPVFRYDRIAFLFDTEGF